MPAERWSAVDGRRLDFKALEEAGRINLRIFFFRSVLFRVPVVWSPFQRLMGGVFGDVVVAVVVRDGPKLSKSFFDVEEVFLFSRRSLKPIVPTTNGSFLYEFLSKAETPQASVFFFYS